MWERISSVSYTHLSDGMQKMNGVINADLMTVEEIHQKLDAGYKDMENGRVREASEVFAEFR